MNPVTGNNPHPERSHKQSLLKEAGLDFLEDFKPGKIAPPEQAAVNLHNELIRVGILPKQLKSFEISKPQLLQTESSLLSEEVYTGYSATVDRERFYFYFDDFRTAPFIMIAAKSYSSREVKLKYHDNGNAIEVLDQKLALEVYKLLSNLHKNGVRHFQSSAANKPYT